MIFREWLKELIFLIFMIIFDRDDSLINDFSEKDKRFSFAIYFRRESHHFLTFYRFFHRQQSIFQHFHCFSRIIENDRKLSDVHRNFDYFFREIKDFRVHFLLELREISVDTNQFERQKRNLRRCFVSMKRKKRKNDKRRKNLSFTEINEKEVETFQCIRHHEIRKFNRSNRIFESERKNLENQNDFDYFFHRNSSFLFKLTANFFWD